MATFGKFVVVRCIVYCKSSLLYVKDHFWVKKEKKKNLWLSASSCQQNREWGKALLSDGDLMVLICA